MSFRKLLQKGNETYMWILLGLAEHLITQEFDSVDFFFFAIHFANVRDFPNFPVFIMLHLCRFQQIVLFRDTFVSLFF